MQIRIRGRKIEFLRSHYDQGKKRSGQNLLGSIPYFKTELTEELRNKMTDEEVVQAERYFKEMIKDNENWRMKHSVIAAKENLMNLASGIKKCGVTPEQANSIREGIKFVNKALKEISHSINGIDCQ